jgi:hypothetical protein
MHSNEKKNTQNMVELLKSKDCKRANGAKARELIKLGL